MLEEQVGKLDQAVEQSAASHPQARLLMTQPGVGPNTALAFVLTIGDVRRFPRGKQVASYLGLIPPPPSIQQTPRSLPFRTRFVPAVTEP
jgi:transposase